MNQRQVIDEADKPPSDDTDPLGTITLPFQSELFNELPPVLEFLPSYESILKSKYSYFPISERSDAFRKKYFPDASVKDWINWHWQLKNRVHNREGLEKFITLSQDEKNFFLSDSSPFPISITPHFLSLIDPDKPADPLRRTAVPVYNEKVVSEVEMEDPLSEDDDSPVPGIVHRYPDRVLFLTTHFCSTYCRYCTRSRLVAREEKQFSCFANWEKGIEYIRNTPVIRDVLLSGGDPLTLPDNHIQWLLSQLRSIPHVQIIRIGTKTPVVLPQRITMQLVRMLKRYHPLYINIHFTHPAEFTTETEVACTRLADAGIPLGSQTVLLSGINNNVSTMKSLMHGLLKLRVKPYYIYQCDLVPGSGHFRTSVENGLEIIEGLRGHTSGLAVPHYVIDAPNGGGKIPLLPSYVESASKEEYVLRNYKKNRYVYPQAQ